jgi:hypothetical protein
VGQSVRFGRAPRLVTAAAATPCAILIVTDTALSRVAEQCLEIWRAVARLLYEQLRYALRFGADVSTLPPTQMVAARPSDIAEVAAALDALPLSQQALGEMTGLTRKTINAVLRRPQADKVLTCEIDCGRSLGFRRDQDQAFPLRLPRCMSATAESARGISPRAAHRTGHKPLDLSGSCHRMKAAAFH